MSNEKSLREALADCPYCGVADGDHDGGLPFLRVNAAGHKGPEYVHCYHCGASGPRRDTEAEAIAAWNERLAAHPEEPGSDPVPSVVEQMAREIRLALEAMKALASSIHRRVPGESQSEDDSREIVSIADLTLRLCAEMADRVHGVVDPPPSDGTITSMHSAAVPADSIEQVAQMIAEDQAPESRSFIPTRAEVDRAKGLAARICRVQEAGLRDLLETEVGWLQVLLERLKQLGDPRWVPGKYADFVANLILAEVPNRIAALRTPAPPAQPATFDDLARQWEGDPDWERAKAEFRSPPPAETELREAELWEDGYRMGVSHGVRESVMNPHEQRLFSVARIAALFPRPEKGGVK